MRYASVLRVRSDAFWLRMIPPVRDLPVQPFIDLHTRSCNASGACREILTIRGDCFIARMFDDEDARQVIDHHHHN